MAKEIGLFEAMYSQRAIRRFKPDPVPDELILQLIEAATKAPSATNRQPWAFIVIRDPKTKQKLGGWYLDAWNQTYDALPQGQRPQLSSGMARVYRSAGHLARHLGQVPVLILVCIKDAPPPGTPNVASHYASAFPAVQNLLLAARGLGLGAVLTTLHKRHEQEVKELLGIPETVETVALIPVGYPIGSYGPTTRRPLEEIVHKERWEVAKE